MASLYFNVTCNYGRSLMLHNTKVVAILVEQFSLECQKVMGFA